MFTIPNISQHFVVREDLTTPASAFKVNSHFLFFSFFEYLYCYINWWISNISSSSVFLGIFTETRVESGESWEQNMSRWEKINLQYFTTQCSTWISFNYCRRHMRGPHTHFLNNFLDNLIRKHWLSPVICSSECEDKHDQRQRWDDSIKLFYCRIILSLLCCGHQLMKVDNLSVGDREESFYYDYWFVIFINIFIL